MADADIIYISNRKILDIVLVYMNEYFNKTAGKYIEEKELENYMVKIRGIFIHNIKIILQKLFKDNFIEVYQDCFIISFEGKMFIEDGGYEKQLINETNRNNRIENLEKNQIIYQRILIWLTALVALGTIVTGIYYGIEIYKHFYPSKQNTVVFLKQ